MALLITVASQPALAAQLLGAPFADHAVLQRDQPILVWGIASPGARISVTLAGHETSALASKSGAWKATLPALAAGGPFTLEVQAGQRHQRVDDVLVGDVWLCGGQSNMEFPVERALDANAEIANAFDSKIRLLRVPKSSADSPNQAFSSAAAWSEATPDTVRSFSAVCWYFAKSLRRDLEVPLGLISASWNGSRIEAWTSQSALRRAGGLNAELALQETHARDPDAAIQPWAAMWERWWRKHQTSGEVRPPWSPDAAGDWSPTHPSSRWVAPALADHVGLIWFRTTVELSASQALQGGVLELGRADEIDTTWVNGHGVGTTYGSAVQRRYAVAPGILHAGSNTIVVNVLNTYRQGGLNGSDVASRALVLADGVRLPLEKAWQVRPEPEAIGMPPAAPWMSAYGLGTLYNGMIAPLAGYGLRGALWYQGESNTHEPERYGARLATWRDDFRAHFGADLPLVVVQLAGYGPAATAPGQSAWATLREEQRRLVAQDQHAALAVTIDLGEHGDIHPANKQEVGRRAALAALAQVYRVRASPTGPVPLQARREGDDVLVRFGGIEGALAALGGQDVLGFELCDQGLKECRYPHAAIEGDIVRLSLDGSREATTVRYAWADSPILNLYDGSERPAGPFVVPIN
nr:sialate O-acetylesterase [Pseudoxanthomonas sp. GM95]